MSSRIRMWIATAGLGALTLAASACVVRETPVNRGYGYGYASTGYNAGVTVGTPSPYYVSSMPPEPLYETMTSSPGYGYVWIDGYWHWSGYEWVWVPGRWTREQSGYVYVQPYYDWDDGGRYVYYPGHWSRPDRVSGRVRVVRHRDGRPPTGYHPPRGDRPRTRDHRDGGYVPPPRPRPPRHDSGGGVRDHRPTDGGGYVPPPRPRPDTSRPPPRDHRTPPSTTTPPRPRPDTSAPPRDHRPPPSTTPNPPPRPRPDTTRPPRDSGRPTPPPQTTPPDRPRPDTRPPPRDNTRPTPPMSGDRSPDKAPPKSDTNKRPPNPPRPPKTTKPTSRRDHR